MTKNCTVAGIDRRALVSGMAAVSALGGALPTAAQAQTPAASGGFSFAACGDSRPMMYLPYKDGHPDLVRLFVEMFGLVMPERVAEEVVLCQEGARAPCCTRDEGGPFGAVL